ncbi:hypothetical protein GEMRC1_001770 [Eukaryota sp. GEM-RC1]
MATPNYTDFFPKPNQSAFDNADGFCLKNEQSANPPSQPPVLRSPNPRHRIDRSIYSPTPRAVDKSQPSPNQCASSLMHISYTDFEVLGTVGSGSFGDVYKVRSPQDGELYAIKKLHPYKGIKDRQRRIREVMTVRKLGNHPHIVQYIDGWEECGCLHIQSELCELGSLASLLQQNGPLEEEVIWNFILDITLGLKHLHDNRILHLDIKPSNLLLTQKQDCYELKLGDFGMAILESEIKSQWTSGDEGDAAYMAPELLGYNASGSVKRSVGRAADLFSLGCTLFEMAAHLTLPASGPMWQLLRSGRVELSPHVGTHWYKRSEEMQSLCLSLLNPVPFDRPLVDDVLSTGIIKGLLFERYDEEVPFPPVIQNDNQVKLYRQVPSRGSSVTDLFSSINSMDQQSMNDDDWLMSSEPANQNSSDFLKSKLRKSKSKRIEQLRRPSFLSIDCSHDFLVTSEDFGTSPKATFPSLSLDDEEVSRLDINSSPRFLDSDDDEVLQ